VAAGTDHEFANRVFRRAQVQMDLAPEWKVYFALWLRANATRQGIARDADADMVFADLASGEGWWARLASFGAGALPYAQLLQAASSVGERTEAHFYEGMRLLAAGKKSEADALLRQVIETQMINFYEFTMAHELLESGITTTTTTPVASATIAPTTTTTATTTH
jgi:lipoprotein NlpI